METELKLTDYVRTALRVVDKTRERMRDEHLPLNREAIAHELTQAETSLRRALHLIGE